MRYGDDGEPVSWRCEVCGHVTDDPDLVALGVVYGIRPHRPMSREQAELARSLAEQVPPIPRDELRRQGLLP